MRAELYPIEGGTPIIITKDLIVVGRKPECDLRLDHKSVSKMHCVIVKTDGLLLLRDLGSTNGTRVNGQRVRRAALMPDDELTIAGFKFRIEFGQAGTGRGGKAHPHDHTQRMNANEVVHLLKKASPAELATPAVPTPRPVKPNHLPDVYPAEESKSS